MSTRRYVTLRVVPAALGAYTAMTGAFKLMEFAEFKPVVYLVSETCSLFLEKPEEIAAYQRILAALADAALEEGESRELIAAVAPSSPQIERTMMTAPEPEASSGTRAATVACTATASRSRPHRSGS